MDVDKQALNEVKDLFDIKYEEAGTEEVLVSTEGLSTNFADLENGVSSVISNMEDKGEALETTLDEVVKEAELETIQDLIADSVEEAAELTKVQKVEEKVSEKIAEFESVDDFDCIEVVVAELNVVNKDNDVITEEAIKGTIEDVQVFDRVISKEELEDVEKQLSQVVNDPNLVISSVHIVSDPVNPDTKTNVEALATHSPAVLEEEDIDIIPQKDSEGQVKGQLMMKNVVDIALDNKGKTIIKGGEIVWNMQSPTALYDEFYAIKNEKINIFSGGQQLDFDRLYQELYSTSVDTSTEVLDGDILMHKLDSVVKSIDRVAMIQLQVNHQQFVWKRFVELLRGALARVQYLKPVLKQEGLQLEHMGDVEFYTERLNSLRESAHDCMKNLEKAFESLSRKISVMLTVQGKHTPRISDNAYGGNSSQTYQAPPPLPLVEAEETVVEANLVPTNTVTNAVESLQDYDCFEVGVKVKPAKPKPGECDWDDVW